MASTSPRRRRVVHPKPTTDKSRPAPKWKEFENDVAALYKAMGYKVRPNQKIAGQQIDLIAERYVEGIGHRTVVIECKFRSKGSVSNQDVYDFIHFYQSTKNLNDFSAAIIVTNTSFSPEAYQAATQAPGLFLKTLQEVEDSVFDATADLVGYVQDYETQPIFTSYIHLSGFGRTPPMSKDAAILDVDLALTQWLTNGTGGFVTLLGDFGAGKTTLLNRLRYTFSKMRLPGHSPLIPLYLELKTLMYYEDLDEFLKDTISSTVSLNVQISAFWRLLSTGRLLLLLDGFDDVATYIDTKGRAAYIQMLQPLLVSQSPVVMTCRPSYFVSAAEYNNILSEGQHRQVSLVGTLPSRELGSLLYDKYVDARSARRLPRNTSTSIILRPLQDKQIAQYLGSHEQDFQSTAASGWLEIKDRLGSIYDLRDLMTRPILLSMITDTIILGRLDLRIKNSGAGHPSCMKSTPHCSSTATGKKARADSS